MAVLLPVHLKLCRLLRGVVLSLRSRSSGKRGTGPSILEWDGRLTVRDRGYQPDWASCPTAGWFVRIGRDCGYDYRQETWRSPGGITTGYL